MEEEIKLISHPILNKHESIGWDVDETLINGPKSLMWRRYVTEHKDTKDHYIITFRDDKDAETVFDELEDQFLYPLKKEWFSGIRNMPRHVSDPYADLHPYLHSWNVSVPLNNKVHRILEREKLSVTDFYEIKENLYSWKARTCQALGCGVLVDDLEKICKKSCEELEIDFVNSLKG